MLSLRLGQLSLLLTVLGLCGSPHLPLDLLQRMNARVQIGTEVQTGRPVYGARLSSVSWCILGSLGREVVVCSTGAIAARKNRERRFVGPDCLQLRRVGCMQNIRIGRATRLE